MSEWVTPKTDWESTDYINIDDWMRIAGNLCYLKNLADKIYRFLPWRDIEISKTYYDRQSAEDWNNIEENLKSLFLNIYSVNSGKQMTFYENGSVIDCTELNRIEETILNFYNRLTSQYENAKVLAFTLGGDEFA